MRMARKIDKVCKAMCLTGSVHQQEALSSAIQWQLSSHYKMLQAFMLAMTVSIPKSLAMLFTYRQLHGASHDRLNYHSCVFGSSPLQYDHETSWNVILMSRLFTLPWATQMWGMSAAPDRKGRKTTQLFVTRRSRDWGSNLRRREKDWCRKVCCESRAPSETICDHLWWSLTDATSILWIKICNWHVTMVNESRDPAPFTSTAGGRKDTPNP